MRTIDGSAMRWRPRTPSRFPRIPVPPIRRPAYPRAGAAATLVLVMLASLLVLVLLAVALMRGETGFPGASNGEVANAEGAGESLVVYCAASNKSVIEAIRRDYEAAFGRAVTIQYGSAQTLLASMQVSRSADLFLPADTSYLDMARRIGFGLVEYPLARMNAVLAVPLGNPKAIRTFSDLLRPGVRVAQASAESAAIGKLTRETLSHSGNWDRLAANTVVFKTTVNDVANDVKLGSVDAGIVFDAVLHDYETLERVAIPELESIQAHVSIGLIASSPKVRAASHFARFASARDKGLAHYRAHGFQAEEGDTWSDAPELILYAGSMLRPAIEKTITAFEEREGCRVTRVYNGCGILVAQMKAGNVPDAYFACDSEFMDQVSDLFPESSDVSRNELVILVKKGNPFDIRSLRDLTRPGLRVGIGHEKQCAMGWLTQRTFTESGLQTELMANVVVQTPTGDMLVNQMRSGSLDAAVAYLSNAAGAADALDAIRIQGIPCSIATQPFGIASGSDHTRLAGRLLDAIRERESRERFASEGFQWVRP